MKKIAYDGFVQVEIADNGHEIVRASDSVAVFIYDRDSDRVLFVEQERKPMISKSNPSGRTTEVVAGRFDTALTVKALAVKEVREEVGVTITEKDVRILNKGKPLALSPGILTERTYVAYVEIGLKNIAEGDDDSFGCKDENEHITRKFVSAHDLARMVHDNIVAFALVQWFLHEGCAGRI